jgi:tetratricopeptide (TPR) repeat protein
MLSFSRIARRTILAVLAIAALGIKTYAQDSGSKENYLSDNVSEEIRKLSDLQEKKLWDEANKLLTDLLKTVKADSFDEATIYQYIGRVCYLKNDLHAAIAPMEKALSIAAKHDYFKLDALQEMRILVIQAVFMDAQVKGLSLVDQRTLYLKALSYMDIWNANNKKPSPEVTTLHAYILFGLAQSNLGVPNKLDPTYINKAQDVIERALTEMAKPKDVLYQLLIACLQQNDNYTRMAEIYEMLVKLQPNNKQNWQTLFATYYQLSQDPNPDKAFEYAIRSINTLDRAQALGHLNTSKDNFNRVAIYVNIQQYKIATELLEKGLMDGGIEDTSKNWEILSYYFQQIGKDEEAIRVLREACKRYPDHGSFHILIAQSYFTLDKPRESYDEYLAAIKVGNLDKPYLAYTSAASMAFQLRLFEEGLAEVAKALEYPEAKKDAQLPKLKTALEEGIRERELNKKAVEAQHKNL